MERHRDRFNAVRRRGLRASAGRGLLQSVFLARTLAAHHVRQEIDLFTLSTNIQDVFGTEILSPEKSTLLGPCIVIRQEYPNFRTKSIDFELPRYVSEYETVADLVFGEFLEPDWSLFVAYRNAQRWVQIYEPIVLSRPGHRESSFRERGVYLITGGLGSVGIAISEYLAKTYRAKLVLVGRSNLPSRETWSSLLGTDKIDRRVQSKMHAIERLEALGGEVLYVSASVADPGAMQDAIRKAYHRFDALHGVIHGAGIVGDSVYTEIKDSDRDDCEEHFQSKACGARVLEEVLAGIPLEICLLLSSLTSILGGVGQVAYASANIYLDSFVRKHNRSHAVPWLSVNWDVWRIQQQTGIALGLGNTLRELGMTAGEGFGVMESVLLARKANQIVVSTGDLGARLEQWVNLESLNTGGRSAATSPDRLTISHRPSLDTNYDAPRDETELRIAKLWQDTLGIDEIGINDNFSRLGGHSLLAIKIVAELRKTFEIDLPIRALFDAPTIVELSDYIKRQIIAEIETLTDEEARLLVSNGRRS